MSLRKTTSTKNAMWPESKHYSKAIKYVNFKVFPERKMEFDIFLPKDTINV